MKLILTAISAAALLNVAAFAGDLVPVQIANAHGQSVTLYRSSEPTVALYSGGRGAGSGASVSDPKTVSVPNGHGQVTILNRAE